MYNGLEKLSEQILPEGAGMQIQRQPHVEMNSQGRSQLIPRKLSTSVLWAVERPGPGGTIARTD